MSSFRDYTIACPHCGIRHTHELVNGNQSVTCQRGHTCESGSGQAGCGKSFRVSVMDGNWKYS